MSSNGSTPEAPKPESAQSEQGLKSLIAKGAVGAVTLAGTTAIPLMVQKYLSDPAPPAPTVQASPVQASPVASPIASPVAPPIESPIASPVASPVLLPTQAQTEPNQAGIVQIQAKPKQVELMQVEIITETNSKKSGTRKKQNRDDDGDDD
jgi:hypothetical protein